MDLISPPEEEVLLTKKGTIRKRKPKKSILYFTSDTEEAIIEYLASKNQDHRNHIFDQRIDYAFHKLAENIIHTFKFYYTDVDTINELKHEVVAFLLEKLHLYDQSKGKAYSYFGTIAKRYLILSNQKNYKKRIDTAPIETLEEDERHSYEMEDTQPIERLSAYIDKFAEHCTENIFEIFPKEEDAQIADAILELFRKRENLDIFNKKALYIYIREIIDVKTPKITKIANVLYEIFKKGYVFYLDHGYTRF